MTDNLKIRQPEDPLKINLDQFWEVNYWTKELGISVERLKQAVGEVGVMVVDVKDWLKNH